MTDLVFCKWEGLGNDFVVVDARFQLPPEPDRLAQLICDRHFGVGADGLALITPANQSAAFGMEIYNSDGSQGLMCGNALRCLAAYASREGFAPAGTWFEVATASGPRRVRVDPSWIEVDMGSPQALRGRGPVDSVQLEDGRPAYLVSMGNPHCVIPLEGQPAPGWQAWAGPVGEGPLAPRGGMNVELVQVHAPDHLQVWVWERGVGATLACGTGACAALVALAQAGLCSRQARVSLPGGELVVEWSEAGPVLMRGPARQLFTGEWRPDP